MVRIKPFRGLRPTPDKIAEVASPPYDVLNSDEAREKAAGNPISFLHVVKPEIDLPADIDIHDKAVYQKGSENLQRLISDGVMMKDEQPSYYVYKLKMGDHEQVGLVALASVADYLDDRIKKHEHTRPDKEQDRMNHIKALNAQTGPVFLTYKSDGKVNSLINEAMKKPPVYDFTGDYEVQHTLFTIEDPGLIKKITDAFADVEALYVADGHHRSAAATNVCLENMKTAGHTGEEPYNYFLTVIFPDSQMRILDYNRVVKDLNGMDLDGFLKALSEKFDVEMYTPCCGVCNECGDEAYKPGVPHSFGMYTHGQWFILRPKEGTFKSDDPIESLDVAILQNNLLSPILGIENPRTDKRIHFVGGIRGLGVLERLVDSNAYKVAFSLYPTGIRQLMAVADAGLVMPPKSTWFEPKLRSGVIIHHFGDNV
jgi:uncharacterized protein (DUF1015 family)